MLKALIVDDEYPARKELRYLLEKHDNLQVVGEAANATEALQLIVALDYSVVFVDIRMPGMTGIELCRIIQHHPSNPLVVFVTAHQEYALEAFGVDAVDFLLKPIDPRRLDKAINKIANIMAARSASATSQPDRSEKKKPLAVVPVEHRGKTVLLEEKNVIYIYACNDYTYIKTANEKYLTRYTLKDLEQRLNNKFFCRCHRSYMVNIRKIREVIPLYNGTLLLIVDDMEKSEVPTSRSQSKKMREILGI